MESLHVNDVVGGLSTLPGTLNHVPDLPAVEQHFQLLADFIPQLMWMARPDGWIYWYNRQCYDYTGATLAQMEGWGWQHVHDPQELPRVLARWQESIQTGEPFEMTFPLRGRDGYYRPFLTRIVPVRDEAGQVIRWIGTNTDISEQRAAEASFLESETRLRAIMDATSECIDIVNPDGGLVYMNPAGLRMIGSENLDAAKGVNVFDWIAPDYRAQWIENHQRICAGEMRGWEYDLLTAQGERRRLETFAVPLPGPGGVFKHLGVSRDITERRHAEAEMTWTNRLLTMVSDVQNLFFGNQDIYDMFEAPLQQLLDLTGSEYGFIGEILHDEAGQPYLKCCFLTNISWDEETRQLWESSRPTGFEFHKLDNLFGRVITSGEVVVANDPAHDARRAPLGRPPGHPPLNAFLGLPFHKNGKLLGMVGIANRPGGYEAEMATKLLPFLDACANIIEAYRNQREREKLTRELQVSERATRIYAARLERSNQELEQFAAIASHDLQAPLRKIQIFADHLKSIAGERLETDALEDIDRIERAANRLQMLVLDLLALSRVTRKGAPFEPVPLAEVVHGVVDDLQADIEATGGRVIVGPLDVIEADRTQMRQLLQNILHNSLKFHRPGMPPVVEVNSVITNDTCEIRIRDNGIGFKAENMDKIFMIFQRLHGESDYPGTGIGLSICKKIVERHGGVIRAESTPGEGSVFIIELPVRHGL